MYILYGFETWSLTSEKNISRKQPA